jgi:hypothetical protein
MRQPQQAELAVSLESGYALARRGPGVLRLGGPGGKGLTGQVTRLSPALVWFSAEQPQAPGHHLELPSLYLEGEGTTLGPLRAQALWGMPRRGGIATALRLVGLSVEQGRRMLGWLQSQVDAGAAEPVASPLPVEEDITEPGRIRSLLAALHSDKARGRLRQLGRGGRVALESVEPEAGILWWNWEEPEGAWSEGAGELELVGYNSAYRLAMPQLLEQHGPRVATSLPTRLRRLRHRWHRRVAAPPGLRVRLQHPLWPELGSLEREVLNLGFGGLGLRISEEDLLFPGLRLQPLELIAEGGLRVRLRGEVRHVSTINGPRVCGLQVAPLNPQEEVAWWRLISQVLHPSTASGEPGPEPLWELLTRAHALPLAGRYTSLPSLKGAFLESGRRAAQAPQVFCQGVWRSPQGVEASLCALKAWQHTWLLAPPVQRVQGPSGLPGPARRELYLRALEHAQGDGDFRWAVALVEAEDPWLRPVHTRFTERYSGSGQVLLQPLRLMEVGCAEPLTTGREGCTVALATPGERLLLTEHLTRTKPACYLEALDLTLARLDMQGIALQWRRLGLERQRRILVARCQGEPVAAAVLESGPAGTHLLGPVEGVQLFAFTPWGRNTYTALLEEARQWFARAGRSSFLLLGEDEGWQPPAAAPLYPLGRVWQWVLPARLVPEFLEHVHETALAPQAPRA